MAIGGASQDVYYFSYCGSDGGYDVLFGVDQIGGYIFSCYYTSLLHQFLISLCHTLSYSPIILRSPYPFISVRYGVFLVSSGTGIVEIEWV